MCFCRKSRCFRLVGRNDGVVGLADVSRKEINWLNLFDTWAHGGGSFVILCVKKLLCSLFKEGRKGGGRWGVLLSHNFEEIRCR